MYSFLYNQKEVAIRRYLSEVQMDSSIITRASASGQLLLTKIAKEKKRFRQESSRINKKSPEAVLHLGQKIDYLR